MKQGMKLVALVVSLGMLVSSVPFCAAAENQEQKYIPSAIVEEVVSKRGAYEKHFLCEDGSFVAVTYSEQVHYQINDAWNEIDNTLEQKSTRSSVQTYQNKDGLFDITFSNETQADWVTINTDGGSMSWNISATAKKTKVDFKKSIIHTVAALFGVLPRSGETVTTVYQAESITDVEVKSAEPATLTLDEAKLEASKASSTISYKNVLTSNVDVEYTVKPNSVVERIILEKPDDIVEWNTNITLNNLFPELNDDNTVDIKDSDGRVVFHIPPPFMEDAKGELSEKIDLQLRQNGSGSYILVMKPDAEWLNSGDRAYPVVIDPTVTVPNGPNDTTDTYIATGDGNGLSHAELPYLRFGRNGSTEYYSYIKFNTLPSISADCLITRAELSLTTRPGQTTFCDIQVAMPLSDWTTSLSWQTNPYHYPPIATDVSPVEYNAVRRYTANVREAVSQWYKNPSSNHGLKIYSTDNDYNSVYSANADGAANDRPNLIISYIEPTIDVIDDEYFIRGCNTKYMDIDGAVPASGARVRQQAFTGALDQRWFVRRGDDKSYTIHSMADSSLYLTQAGNIDQDLVWLTVNSASNANRWYFYETIYGYLIRPACSRTRVLDVYGMSSGPGVWNWDISSFTFLGGVNQGWMLERVPEPDSPLEFQVLHGAGLLSYAQIQNTSDDFYICTKSLADILVAAGIPTLYDTDNTELTPPVHGFYDDWYLFAVPKAKGYTIGLFKMREQEDDAYDGNDPGVTISFVAFDFDLFYMCLRSKIKEDCLALNSEIDKVTSDKGVQYDGVMQAYFSNPASEGAYLIAEAYVKFMAGTAVNRTLAAPDQYLSLLKKIEDIDVLINSTWDGNIIAAAMAEKEKLSRIPDALAANNQAAGYAIFSDNTIHLLSRNSPTTREAYAILMLHTANVNYNSFAAEVKFHSDALVAPWADIDKWYDSALRADMAIGEEAESGFFDKYYDLEGDLVQEQIQYHGER